VGYSEGVDPMKADRRQFLIASGGFAIAQIVRAEEPAFTLWFPPAMLDLSKPFGFAVAASAACRCEVDLVDKDKQSLLSSPNTRPKWDLEPKRAQSKLIETPTSQRSPESATAGVFLQIRPYTDRRPHFAGVLQTGGEPVSLREMKPQHAAFVRASFGDRRSDKERLEQTAERLPFVGDPAPRPQEGHFTVALRSESRLHVKIWVGENQRGAPIYDHVFGNLPAGDNSVPWGLKNNRGSIVDAGEYLATLVATPRMTGRSDTLYFASFQVI
jgi:hypothetical protein